MLSRYLSQWPGGLPQRAVVDLRGLDLLVAARATHLARERDERVEHLGAGRQPEGGTRGDLGELEQAELRPEPPVIVGPRALEPLEMGLEILPAEERRPIHAREHRPAGVAPPVRAGHRLELERLDPPGARRVRAPAEVGERAVGVQRDRLDLLVAHQVLDQLDLVRLVLGQEALERLARRDVVPHERLVGGDVLAHLRLERSRSRPR